MHILFTAYEFVSEKKPCGGFGRYLANVATILSDRGHEVTILLSSDRDDRFTWHDKVDVIVFDASVYVKHGINIEMWIEAITGVPESSDHINLQWQYKAKIEEIDKYKKIDIVQYCGDFYGGWYLAKGIPAIVRFSSIMPWYRHADNPDNRMEDMSWLNSYEMKLLLCAVKHVKFAYGPSEYVVNIYKRFQKKRYEVIESPYLADLGAVDNEKKISNVEKYLLFMGRICTMKGVDTIANAIFDIMDNNRDIHFVFAGNVADMSLKDKVIKNAGIHAERIVFLGEIKDRNYLLNIVYNAAACVLPSRADNLPNSCIEAMGLGKIVIGTYESTIDQLIDDEINGFLIERDNSKMLTDVVKKIIDMAPAEKAIIERNAKDRVNRVSVDDFYSKIMNLYRKAMGEQD